MIKVISKKYEVDVDLFEDLASVLSSVVEVYLIDKDISEEDILNEIGDYNHKLLVQYPAMLRFEKGDYGQYVYIKNLDAMFEFDEYVDDRIRETFEVTDTESHEQNLNVWLYIQICRALLSMNPVVTGEDNDYIQEILHQELRDSDKKKRIYNCLKRL